MFIFTDFLSPISINSDNNKGVISTSIFIREIKTISMNDKNQPCTESTISRETGNCDSVNITLLFKKCFLILTFGKIGFKIGHISNLSF